MKYNNKNTIFIYDFLIQSTCYRLLLLRGFWSFTFMNSVLFTIVKTESKNVNTIFMSLLEMMV